VSDNKLKAHKRECETWLARDKKAVRAERMRENSLAKHGVENPMRSPEANAKRAETNLARYGAENPFARGANTFEKVQASLEGKRPVLRGAENPFAKPEVQAKIRASMLEKHGAENPQQSPEIRARTSATCEERYGGVLMASPEIAEKARATNRARYGDAFPQRTETIRDKIQDTNILRYGVPWTSMDPETRRKQLETHHERWGSHYFASDEGKAQIRSVMIERFGVEFPGAIEGHWGRLVETFKQRYGVEHPLQLAEFLDKQRSTNLARYGTIFPGLRLRGRNGLETKVFNLAPPDSLIFTGDGGWWRRLPHFGRYKNPDFIVPGPDPENPKRGVTRVVEAFGDYWHSKMFTGRAPFEHEGELIDAYKEVGIDCLVLWESEVLGFPEEAQIRLLEFLQRTQ
jgi:hypothetical protein